MNRRSLLKGLVGLAVGGAYVAVQVGRAVGKSTHLDYFWPSRRSFRDALNHLASIPLKPDVLLVSERDARDLCRFNGMTEEEIDEFFHGMKESEDQQFSRFVNLAAREKEELC